MHWRLKNKQQHQQLNLVRQATERLVLENFQLTHIAKTLGHELNCALVNGSSPSDSTDKGLRVYPTFIDQVPDGCERGHYLALDLGGTNFRVLLIHLQGNRHSSVFSCKYTISQQLMQGRGEDLFDYIAQCVFNFSQEQGVLGQRLKLGFTFSFPCTQTSRSQAVLTKWTKGFSCSGVVGADIGEMLKRSLAKYTDLHVEVAAIVNDTTGTLISCAYQEPDCRMGVIIGTGVNICYMESNYLDTEMIINTELGAFGSGNQCLDFIRTEWDMLVDKRSINSGQQVFEKMVSGMYLGEIVRTIVVDLARKRILNPVRFAAFEKQDSFDTSCISRVELDLHTSSTFENTQSVLQSMGICDASLVDCACLHLICTRVSCRSAHLTSAVISALLHRMNRLHTTIGVDGTVYRLHPHYKSVINEKIAQLLPLLGGERLQFQLMLSEDGSGRGASLVAALPCNTTTTTNNQIDQPKSKCTRCKEPNCPLPGQFVCRMCMVAVA